MLGKRLINSNSAAAGGSCTTDTLNILGDSPNSCVAYYKMSDATDESGNYDGTPTSVNFNVSGKFGNAGDFNGSSSYIDTNTKFTPTLMSFSAWVNPTVGNVYGVVISNRASAPNYYGIEFGINNNSRIYSRFTTPSGSGNSGADTVSLPVGTWTQIGFTISGSEAKVYKNGALEYTVSIGTIPNTLDFHIGKQSGSSSTYFNGKIDQIRIFNKALTSTEVTTLYNEVYCVPTIVPTDNFNTVLYTGNNSTNVITTVGFQPDLSWFKNRQAANSNALVDSVRGRSKVLFSDADTADSTSDSDKDLVSFDINGFTLGAVQRANSFNKIDAANNIVAWNWYAPTAQSIVASGSRLASTIKKNVAAGFSIVKYTGGGGAATVGHGLDSAPQMYIVKSMGHQTSWYTYHIGLDESSPEDYNVRLNETSARQDSASYWNDTAPTSSVFSIGTTTGVSKSSTDFITYCFHSVDGMSRVGRYVGSDSTQSIVTNFRPAFVLIKTTSDEWWNIVDNKRNGTLTSRLYANSSAAEGSFTNDVILNSNGFTVLGNNSSLNDAGRDFIFLAIAEEVFTPITRNATNPFGDASELALYKFEDNANDAEGSYNGTATSSVTYPTGYIDKAVSGFTSSQYVSIPTMGVFLAKNTSSVSMWILSSGATSPLDYIFADYSGSSFNHGIYLSTDGKIHRSTRYNSSETDLSSTNSCADGSWHHVVSIVNVSNNTHQLYIDGSLNASGTVSTNSWSSLGNTEKVLIGGLWGSDQSNNLPFGGSIDQVRIFNRALDSGEVLQLYNE